MCDTQTSEGCVSARVRQLSKGDVELLTSYVERKAESARLRGTKRSIIDELLVLLLLNTGIRAGELCELKLQDMSVSEEGVPSINVPGDPPRNLVIPVDLYNKFQRYFALHRESTDPDSPLLVSEQGNPINYQNIYLKIKSIGKKAGLEDLHPYMLRHYFLCQLYEKEHDLKLVQIIGGYRDPKTAALSLDIMI